MIAPYLDDAGSPPGGGAGGRDAWPRGCSGRGDAAPFAGKLIPTLEKVAQAASDETLANRAKAVLQQARNKAGAK